MVRNLALLLLLANVLFWAWQRWVVPPEAADALALQASRTPELVLLNRAPGAVGGPGIEICLRVGPFESAGDAGSGAAELRGRGLRVAVEAESVEVWLGHWVQIPEMARRSDATDAREALAAAGLADAYVVRTDSGFKISLGVFRDKTRADRVADMAQGAGFSAITTDRTRDGEAFWLLVGPTAEGSLDLAGLESSGERILRSESVACPGNAADSGTQRDSLESAAAVAPMPE
jgi:cell division septation protein DedD